MKNLPLNPCPGHPGKPEKTAYYGVRGKVTKLCVWCVEDAKEERRGELLQDILDTCFHPDPEGADVREDHPASSRLTTDMPEAVELYACLNCGGAQTDLRVQFDQPCHQCGKRFSDLWQPKTADLS